MLVSCDQDVVCGSIPMKSALHFYVRFGSKLKFEDLVYKTLLLDRGMANYLLPRDWMKSIPKDKEPYY